MAEHAWCQNIPRDEAVRADEDNRPGPLPTLEECIERVTERRPPEPGGGRNVTGLRTERVTLEITHGNSLSVRDWPSLKSVFGESVRVFEDAALDPAWAERIPALRRAAAAIRGRDEQETRLSVLHAAVESARDERDAAIRERDTLQAERITQSLTADRFAAAVAEADTLKARVEELEAAPAASGAAGTEANG